MQLVRGFSALPGTEGGSVLTIGAYDGLHLGHQALIARAGEEATLRRQPALLLTFEPMPREFLSPHDPPARLTSLRERWRILASSPVTHLWLLRFGEALRNLSAGEFAEVLAKAARARHVVVGHDFRFARHGEATAPVLAAAGERLGFAVEVLSPVMLDGERISSSGVRAALARGEFARAQRWLGRAYSMRGRVIAGKRLGRELGFPTANLALARRRAPVGGIFAVRVRVSAPARRSAGLKRCSRRICSISPGICTAGRSRLNSWRSCARSAASRPWRRSSRRCGATPTRPGRFSPPTRRRLATERT